MQFESLANELLLEVFEYLPSVQLLQAFYNLNYRLNHVLFRHFRSFALDFRSVSHNDFNLICQNYLLHINDYIKSLVLSNNDDTPQQIDLFFKYISTFHPFQYLQSLSIYDLCSNELMNQIMYEWQYLPNLTHLTVAGCYLNFNPINTQQFIDSIWSFSKLIYCYLNVHFGEYNLLIPTVISLSLQYLHIWGIEHNQNELDALLKQTPRLQHLSIILNDEENGNELGVPITSMTKLKICLHSIDENTLVRFFDKMPNLTHLTVEISSSDLENTDRIFNGYQWENLIQNSLPKLQYFRLRMEFQWSHPEQEINDLFSSFRTPFWIEKHQWFIGYHWYSTQNSTSVYLYTLPYAFKDFHFNCSMQFKSTCPDDNLYRYYNHVNELRYTNSLNENSVLSRLRFLNVKQLSIDIPMDENFRTIVPNFDKITSLNVSMNDHHNVQMLINQIPHLDSLSFNPSVSCVSIDELRNVSVRRLDLQTCNHYFNQQEIHSLFGIPCEVLNIKIKNRNVLMDLLSYMIHLRTLNIQSQDDQFCETKEDDFMAWLKDQMPSTYIISRDPLFHSDVHIWIR